MATARIASKTQSKLGFLFYGEQFTGKSTMLMQFAFFKRPDGKPFRVLYLDPESGSIDDYLPELEEQGVDLGNIYIVYTQSLAETEEYIAKAKAHENFYVLDEDGNETSEIVVDADGDPFLPDAIVIDGTTILNLTTRQGLTEFSKKRNKVKAESAGLTGLAKLVKIEGSGMELKDYQVINMKGQNLILDLMASGFHYGVSAREKMETVNVVVDGKTESHATGRKIPDTFKGVEYNVKTECRMFKDENGNVCMEVVKDRTKTFNNGEIVTDPTLCSWQNVIDKTAKNKEFVIKNNLNDSVKTEEKLYQKEIEKSVGTVTADELKSEKTEETETTNDDITTLKKEIKEVIKKVSPADRPAMQAKVKEAGLPLDYTKYTSVDDLKKFLEIIK